ncbi:hypothetical protein AB0B25_08720 [Nocardia sp. NPDC049190]|uniref:hypothetical protein n=1 Tax=Nocardia sp. NPDC049190 TaxID=3155650 RepID=UPI00340C2794
MHPELSVVSASIFVHGPRSLDGAPAPDRVASTVDVRSGRRRAEAQARELPAFVAAGRDATVVIERWRGVCEARQGTGVPTS